MARRGRSETRCEATPSRCTERRPSDAAWQFGYRCMKLRGILVCLALSLLTSCVSGVSGRLPYSSYVGKDLTTKRKSFLYATETDTGWFDFYFGPKKRPCLSEYPAAEWQRSTMLGDVPVGTHLKIKTVKRFRADNNVVQAEGQIYLPGSAKPTTFFWLWAFDSQVERAPWDDDSVPRIRPE
jgi:hypothetical protein